MIGRQIAAAQKQPATSLRYRELLSWAPAPKVSATHQGAASSNEGPYKSFVHASVSSSSSHDQSADQSNGFTMPAHVRTGQAKTEGGRRVCASFSCAHDKMKSVPSFGAKAQEHNGIGTVNKRVTPECLTSKRTRGRRDLPLIARRE